MRKQKSKGMTEAEIEELDFQLFMMFVEKHNLANPTELEALLAKKGLMYLHVWKFKALCELKGITCDADWEQFLKDNPLFPAMDEEEMERFVRKHDPKAYKKHYSVNRKTA